MRSLKRKIGGATTYDQRVKIKIGTAAKKARAEHLLKRKIGAASTLLFRSARLKNKNTARSLKSKIGEATTLRSAHAIDFLAAKGGNGPNFGKCRRKLRQVSNPLGSFDD